MLERFLRIGLTAVILLLPLSFYFRFTAGSGGEFGFKLPPAEPLLWLLLAVWIVRRRVDPGSPPTVFPAPPFIALIAALGLSIAMTRNPEDPPRTLLESFKEIIQAVDYYLIFLLLLVSTFRRRADPQHLFRIVFTLTGMVVVVGALQWLRYTEAPFLVSSVFDNRNILGAFLAVVLPLLFGVQIFEKRRARVALLGAVIVSGFLLSSAVAALALGFAVIAFMSRRLRPRRRVARLLPVAAAAGIALYGALPEAVPGGLLFEPTSLDHYHAIIERNAGMIMPHHPLPLTGLGGGRVELTTSAWPADPTAAEYRTLVGEVRRARSRDLILSQGGPHVRQRFLEWQAALNVLGRYPLVGVGPGRYQEKISYHFYTLPKLNTLEPDTQNGFLVLSSTSGFLGLSAFVWILLHLFALVRAGSGTPPPANDPQPTDFERGLDLGLAGALVSFVAVNVFYNASNHHATMLLFVLLAAMISLRHSRWG